MQDIYKFTISVDELKPILIKNYKRNNNDFVSIIVDIDESNNVKLSYMYNEKKGRYYSNVSIEISKEDIIEIINNCLKDTDYITNEIRYIVNNKYKDSNKALDFEGIECNVMKKKQSLGR